MRYRVAVLFIFALIFSMSAVRADTMPEDSAFTDAAKSFYANFVQDKVDRSKISSELNDLMTDSTIESISKNLRASGDPTWTFVSLTQTDAGRIGVYRLTYPAGSLFYHFGMSKGGTIFTLYFGSKD